jgi:short-subunit dehydrogenase
MAERGGQGRAGAGTALVTGASSGIGLELARVFAATGHDLVLSARSEGKLAALADELRAAHGVEARVVVADLGRPEGAGRLFEAVEAAGVPVDVLVNNAGVGLHGPFAGTSLSRELEMIQLNVTSLTELTKRFLPGMLARKRGRILNVASTAGFVPGPFMAVYYATKAYVISLSVALREELSGTGVTVTVLAPGATRTAFEATAGTGETKLFRQPGVMTARDVAEAGLQGTLAGKDIVVPGAWNRVQAAASGLAPRWLTAKIARSLQDPADEP